MGKRLLWLSDGPGLTTGYSTISRKILNYLADKGWECHFLSHTGVHQTYMPGVELEDGETFKFHVHGSGRQPYCQDIIQSAIQKIKPDVFGILLDTFMCYPWILNLDFAPAKSIFYYPSDGGGGLPLECHNVLRKMDKHVAMSMFAQNQAKTLYNLDSDYIPHAVEPEVYRPLTQEEKLALKKKWGLQGKFVIGTVARNQGRKMLDRTVHMFKKVAEHIPEAILLLHSDKNDPAGYFNFDEVIHRHGLQNRVVFTGTSHMKGFDYKQMNEVYNLMDIFFLGTSGEGFGVPTIEAMSCEIPVLVTDYTTTEEIVIRNDAGEGIKLDAEILGSWNVNRGVMDIEDAADKVIKLYKDPTLREKYGKNGRKAVLKEYNWEAVAEQWHKLLTRMANE